MSLLKDFLLENANVTTDAVEVPVSKRFTDAKGNLMKFKVRPVTGDEFSDYQKKSTRVEMQGKKKVATMDSKVFNNLVIINHCIDPDFKDVEFIKQLNVQTPEQALQKTLLAGEIVELASRISDISGFDTDINDEIEEAKNY